jgi:uncharacterized protein YcfJ
MSATVLARRLRFVKLVLVALLALSSPPAVAQQLGSRFALDDQQTALVRVTPGQFVRVRLQNGTRAGGPLIHATPVALTVGPSVGFGDRDSILRLRSVDSMWVKVYSTRRGTIAGGLIGGVVGLGIGMTSTTVCAQTASNAELCPEGVLTTAASGMLVGGLMGALVGSGRTHWRRVLPQSGSRTPAARSVATLIVLTDSAAYDPAAVALMRVPRGSLVRLTFANRGDLAGYLVRTGARGAELGVVVGHAGDAPIPVEFLESIWERGNAQRSGSIAGLLLGSVTGAVIATQSCGPNNCKGAIIADVGAFALLGYFAGGAIGSRFPKWQRRY